ncbi:M28 family metallopeptidase [Paremcibacter congregatus]|uniref:M28 family metallopeptidase n=1 Tax=Paremcibacter congregatus TaxID=2043170 RepID=UPI003A90A0AC
MKKILGLMFVAAVVLTYFVYDKVPPHKVAVNIDEARLTENIKILASDEFEGRAPGSAGEEKTIAFLKAEFEKLGLKPGNGDSYFQGVNMVEMTANPDAVMHIETPAGKTGLAYGPEFMSWTPRVMEAISVTDSEMIFVGYGIVAPEYDWNDYAGVDVKGKTVVVMVNDPGYATQDAKLFTGNAMTYYGRWTYKYEEAARQGAAAVIIIHETKPASYPWAVVEGSWSGPKFSLESPDGNMSSAKVEAWVPGAEMAKVFAAAEYDYAKETAKAATRAFKPFFLKAKMSVAIENKIRRVVSQNVVAILPGDTRPDEYIIHMSHWDHLGKDTSLEGDQIYNGAADNASGTAGLIELANAYLSGAHKPGRSIMFMAVTAEEQGLLGSSYYGKNPIVPLNKTVAALNMDVLSSLGKTHDVTVIGYGNSELDDYVDSLVRKQKRVAMPDPTPEHGSFYRSDHFSLSKEGVPALYVGGGLNHIEKGREWSLAQMEEYSANRYHKPADEYDDSWDLSGAVQDLELVYKIGLQLSHEDTFPNWREGNEFKAKRDAMMVPAALK